MNIFCPSLHSERRRHFQQQHPKATGQQLNEMMRTAWEKLPARQKLIYFVRAKAVADDKKTSKETDRKQTKIGIDIYIFKIY